MSHSRRDFIQSATLTLVAGVALPGFSQSTANQTFDAENLILLDGVSPRVFESYIGETFSVLSESNAVGSVRLIAVTEFVPPKPTSSKPSSQEVTGFTLRFQGSGRPLAQGVYTLQNHSLGSMSLLLVPSGSTVSPTTYSAVFLHLS
jgi:hypothetical protein